MRFTVPLSLFCAMTVVYAQTESAPDMREDELHGLTEEQIEALAPEDPFEDAMDVSEQLLLHIQ